MKRRGAHVMKTSPMWRYAIAMFVSLAAATMPAMAEFITGGSGSGGGGSSGITSGVTTCTSCPANSVAQSDGAVVIFSTTLPTGIAATNMNLTTPTLGVASGTSLALGGATIGTGALAVTGTSLLSGKVTNALGTITASTPFIISQTWNAGGTEFDGVTVIITDTASAASSHFALFQSNLTNVLTFGKDSSIISRLPSGRTTTFIQDTDEYLIKGNNGGFNALAVQNTNTAGFSAIAFRDSAGAEHSAFGYGNSTSIAPWTSVGYWETSDLTGGTPPNAIVVQTGTIANFGGSATNYTRMKFANTGDILTYSGSAGITQHLALNHDLTATLAGSLSLNAPTANIVPLTISGYSLTGANTQELVNLSGTWNTSGLPTAVLLNITDTASNSGSFLLKLQVGGLNKMTVQKSGAVDFAGSLTAVNSISSTGNINVQAAGVFYWAGTRSAMRSPSDGVMTFTNDANNDFGRLQFGGTTPSFPSIKRAATVTEFRLADDSAYSPIYASTVRTSGYTVAGLPAAGTAGRFAYVTDQLTVCAAAGAALTGGGAVVCPVFDNGVAWVGG